MLLRGLDFSPATEDLPQIARVLAEDLRQSDYVHLDPQPVVEALNALGRELKRWPCTADVIEKLRMPKQPPHYDATLALPFPYAKPEIAAANMSRIREMLRSVGRR